MMVSQYYYTYILGRTLYIPLTSRCNTVSLPQSRGPNFTLKGEVINALYNVRIAEGVSATPTPLSLQKDQQYLYREFLPELHRVACLDDNDDLGQQDIFVNQLFGEVEERRQRQTESESEPFFNSISIAGEGEPLLKLKSLVSLTQKLSSTKHYQDIRVITNGLAVVPQSSSKKLLSCCSSNYCSKVIKTLLQNGVTSFTVALPTANPLQYDELMKPQLLLQEKEETMAHSLVCRFIEEAVDNGANVKVATVHRPDVDQVETIELVEAFGHTIQSHWRSYFP